MYLNAHLNTNSFKPLSVGSQPILHKSSRSNQPLASNKSALLVESDSQLLELHQKTIEELYFQVSIAKDDRIATNFLAQNAYDLIIIHDSLPVINALLLMKIIQNCPQLFRNKNSTICLSCPKESLTNEFKTIFYRHGFKDIIESPISKPQLIDIVNRHINDISQIDSI